MKRNVLLWLAAVSAVVGLTAACSSTAPAPVATPPSAASAPAPAPAPAPVPAPVPAPAPETSPAPESAPTEGAVMTVYREKRVLGMALNTSIYVDGVEVAELDPGTYIRIKLTPGSHRVWADEERDAMPLLAEAGKTYFFRMELVAGLWKGHGKLVAVGAAEGERQFAEFHCKLTDEIKAPQLVAR